MDMILDAYEGGLKVSSAMHYCRIWEYIKFHPEVICTVVTIVMACSPLLFGISSLSYPSTSLNDVTGCLR